MLNIIKFPTSAMLHARSISAFIGDTLYGDNENIV